MTREILTMAGLTIWFAGVWYFFEDGHWFRKEIEILKEQHRVWMEIKGSKVTYLTLEELLVLQLRQADQLLILWNRVARVSFHPLCRNRARKRAKDYAGEIIRVEEELERLGYTAG
jgi:hypothetical protein